MDRRNLLNQHSICFRCLSSSTHQAKDCTTPVKCTECHSDKHLAALHAGPPSGSVEQNNDPRGAQQNGEEPTNVVASCKEMCGTSTGEKSCSKICPANIYPQGHPESKIKAYAVIDDQSNCSLAKPKVFNLLNMNGKASPYTLKTCSGMIQARGRRTRNLIIESLDGTQSHSLPMLTECKVIPDSREFQLQLLLKSTLI